MADNAPRAARLAEILKAIAHPLRLRIVAALVRNALHVNALAERLGRPQAAVSQQLKILRMHRLVTADRRGGRVVYRLLEPQLEVLVSCLAECRTH